MTLIKYLIIGALAFFAVIAFLGIFYAADCDLLTGAIIAAAAAVAARAVLHGARTTGILDEIEKIFYDDINE